MPMNMTPAKGVKIVIPAIVWVLALTVIAYLPLWWNEWAYEDGRMLMYLGEPTDGWWRAPWGRTLTHFSFQLNWYSGAGPRGFHLTSLAIHMVNICLVYALGRSTFMSGIAATVAAVVFALHPAHAETVLYAAVRTDLLSTTFILLGCCCVVNYWSVPPWYRIAAAAGCAWLAIHAKESSIAACAVIPLMWIQTAARFEWRKMAPYVVVAAVTVWYATSRVPVWPDAAIAAADYTTGEYVLGQASAISRLIVLTFIPLPFVHNVDPDYYKLATTFPVSIVPVWALASLVAIAVNVIGFWRRPAGFAIAWALCCVGWRLFVRLPEWTYEHHWYVAMVGISLAVGLAVDNYYIRKLAEKSKPATATATATVYTERTPIYDH